MKHANPTRSSTPAKRGRLRRLPILIVATLLATLFVPQAASAATATNPSAYRDIVGTRFSTFGTISTSGAVVDRFGVGFNFDALTFVPQNVGYGANLFYFVRHDASGFS